MTVLSDRYQNLACRCVSGTVTVGRDEDTHASQTAYAIRVDRRHPRIVFCGVLQDDEFAALKRSLRAVSTVWEGQVKCGPFRRSFRLTWTLPPAPFRLYSRWRILAEIEGDTLTIKRRFRSTTRVAAKEIQSIQSWMSPKGFLAGVSVVTAKSSIQTVRLVNPDAIIGNLDEAPYNQWGVESIDAVAWAGRLGRRMANALEVPWAFHDPNYVNVSVAAKVNSDAVQ
jgi:hypothetical protein